MKGVTIAAVIVAALAAGRPAWAQDSASAQDVRPAVSSYWGDTGLWFVPTAEVLKTRGWAFGVYRTEMDFKQGSSDASYYPGTFAIGAGSRTEIFGAIRAVTAIDRDTRPLFSSTSTSLAGVVNDYPMVRDEWTGTNFGDVYVGAKVNFLSEHRRQPMALAFRGTVKLPTAGEDNVGTGQFDYVADLVASKELGDNGVEMAAFGGVIFRGDPSGVSLSDGVRWGVGAAFGPRSSVRFTTELHGEVPLDDSVVVTSGFTGVDGSVFPSVTDLDPRFDAAVGLTFQHANGMLIGIGGSYRFGLEGRTSVGLQLRLGFHSGVRIFTAPPPLPPKPAPPLVEAPKPAPAPPPVVEAPRPAPAPPPNRPPTVQVQCDPCRVEVGRTVTIRATSQDPDGDVVSARWSVPSGTIADSRATTTTWRAETAPGKVVITVTTEDGRGGTASDSVTIEVMPLQVLADVLFDLDSSTLRPDAIRVLTTALKALNDRPDLRLHVEGYASPEGTAEYNRALSERRARAVRDYLTSRGINASRLTITAYGEERLKFDSSQEATRALNRRAALIIDDGSR